MGEYSAQNARSTAMNDQSTQSQDPASGAADVSSRVVHDILDTLCSDTTYAEAHFRELKNPSKWVSTEAYHSCLWTRFGGIAPMKMPYDFHNDQIRPADVWQGHSVQEAMGDRIHAILDLTDHDTPCYSTVNDRIRHVKLQLTAKTIPPDEEVLMFNVMLAYLFSICDRENPVIAVHCHYGYNRTGYMVCCFLMDVCDISWDRAVYCFALTRPPGIRHSYMVEALKARSDDASRQRAQASFRESMHQLSSSVGK
eukprot:gb/GECG01008141.1/.p1 GENE.gb/GECG01008141.1/~~gb/GECG01008141.1/.p1  ORF type:complete len:254 (+),score=13.68 gb/GECG01008141.1/:1-762(+)